MRILSNTHNTYTAVTLVMTPLLHARLQQLCVIFAGFGFMDLCHDLLLVPGRSLLIDDMRGFLSLSHEQASEQSSIFHLSIYLSIYLSFFLFNVEVYLFFVYLYLLFNIYLSICLSVYLYPFIYSSPLSLACADAVWLVAQWMMMAKAMRCTRKCNC